MAEKRILTVGSSGLIAEMEYTDTIPPENLPDGGAKTVGILVSDPLGDALTTGNGKAYIVIPATVNGMNLTAVLASVSTVSSSGTITVQLRRVRAGSPVDMLSTPITIDASETDSTTAAVAAVIDTSNDDVSTGDQVHVDVDGAGTGAKGLFILPTFSPP